jgi:hypothetical protein
MPTLIIDSMKKVGGETVLLDDDDARDKQAQTNGEQ